MSVSTVSRALNGYADVSAATRLRVQEAAEAMNYQPRAIALMTSVRPGYYLDSTFAALLLGAAEVLRGQGYFALSVVLPGGNEELPEMERLLDGQLMDAVILARTRTMDPRVSLLQERCIPFVTHGRTEANAPHAWLDTDNGQAMYLATRHLTGLGHRRLGPINGPDFMTYALLRQRGFGCHSTAGRSNTTIVTTPYPPQSLYDRIRQSFALLLLEHGLHEYSDPLNGIGLGAQSFLGQPPPIYPTLQR